MSFSESFKFQIPNLQYSQEKALPIDKFVNQKGDRQAEILKGFLGVIPKLQKEVRKEETKINIDRVKAGYIARQKALGQGFKKLRQDKTIGLIDDPFFQRGLSLAEGELQTVAFGEQIKTFYEAAANNPNFFENPAGFDARVKELFDQAYTRLPQNVDTQEGFLGKISPLIAGMQSKYKKDSNIYFGKKTINNQDGLTGAALFSYNNNLSLAEEWNDADILDYAAWVPDASGMTATQARDFFKKEIFDDLVRDLDKIGDSLSNYSDTSALADLGYAAGVTPADIQLDFITKQIEDPHLGLRVINELSGGTGKLKDTEKGKAALNKLWAASKKQAAIDYEKNTAREYSTLVSEVGNFDVFLTDNSFTLDQGKEELEKRIDKLYPAEKYSKNNNRERMRLNNSIARYKRSQNSGGMTAAQQRNAATVASVNNISSQVTSQNTTQSAQALEEQIENNSSTAKKGIIATARTLLADTANPEALWDYVGVISKMNIEGSTNIRPFNSFKNEATLENDSTKLAMLYDAHSKGYLDTFVDEDSRIGKAIRASGEEISSEPEIQKNIFNSEINRLKGLEEVEEFETIYDVNFNSIPVGVSKQGVAQKISSSDLIPEFVSNAGVLNDVFPVSTSNRIAQSYFTELTKNLEVMSEEAAIDEAVSKTEDRYEAVTLLEFHSPLIGFNDKLTYVQDKEGDNLIDYLDSIAGKDEEDKKQKGLSTFLETLRNTDRTGLLFGHAKEIDKNYILRNAPAQTEERIASDIANLIKQDAKGGQGSFAAYMKGGGFNKDLFSEINQEWGTDWFDKAIPFGSLEYGAETPQQVAEHYAKEFDNAHFVVKIDPNWILEQLSKNSKSPYFKVAGAEWKNNLNSQVEEELISIANYNSDLYNSDLTKKRLNEIDNGNFDWDNNVQIVEVQDGIFSLVDENKETLKYTKEALGKVYFTREDLGKFVDSSKFASSEYIWEDIKGVISPKAPNPSDEDMVVLVNDFFKTSFPQNPTDEDFQDKFGDNALTMKMFYRSYKRRGGAK